jgi:hypothetical protein
VSEIDNHFFAVYTSKDTEIEDAAHFLKIGFENNEATQLIINDDGIKKEIIEKLHRKYNISYHEIDSLQKKGDLHIVIYSECCIANKARDISYDSGWGIDNDGGAQTELTLDKAKIRNLLISLVNRCMKDQKTGARVFVSTSQFFRLGLAKAFLDYEIMPSQVSRDFPFTVINAYHPSDVSIIVRK